MRQNYARPFGTTSHGSGRARITADPQVICCSNRPCELNLRRAHPGAGLSLVKTFSVGRGSDFWAGGCFQATPPGLKPTLILLAYAGVETPASLRTEFFRSL